MANLNEKFLWTILHDLFKKAYILPLKLLDRYILGNMQCCLCML